MIKIITAYLHMEPPVDVEGHRVRVVVCDCEARHEVRRSGDSCANPTQLNSGGRGL